MTAAEWTSGLLLVTGAGFYLAGTVGLMRFPDVYTRLHALTKADNLGLGFVVLGLALQAGSLTGTPLTSGWLAKTALKDGLAALPAPWGDVVGIALPLAAVGTTLLMVRLLWLSSRLQGSPEAAYGLASPWLAWTVVGLILPGGSCRCRT